MISFCVAIVWKGLRLLCIWSHQRTTRYWISCVNSSRFLYKSVGPTQYTQSNVYTHTHRLFAGTDPIQNDFFHRKSNVGLSHAAMDDSYLILFCWIGKEKAYTSIKAIPNLCFAKHIRTFIRNRTGNVRYPIGLTLN